MIASNKKNEILAQRLLERMKDLDTNPTAVGKKAGLSASVVRNILEGKSQSPRSVTIVALSEALRCAPSWLLGEASTPAEIIELQHVIQEMDERDGLVRSTRPEPNPVFFDQAKPMKVYASAEGGDGALIISNEPVFYIPRPHVVAEVPDAFGVVIEGESMVRSYRPGDVAWINPMLRERRDEDCIFRGFNNVTGEAKALIKVLVSWTAEEWTVEQLNPSKRYKLNRKEWPDCYRVVGSTKRL